MNKPETNGWLAVVEVQLRAVERALDEVEKAGEFFDDYAIERFREVRIDITAAAQSFACMRGWNRGD
jgi:hypothetical protein